MTADREDRTSVSNAQGGPSNARFDPADDYNGMGEEWKAALEKDVEERFGPLPDDLMAASEVGW